MYTVYRTTNLVNQRFYIGVHKTSNPNDGYLGSGKLIKQAIKHYGKNQFKKDVLYSFINAKDAYEKEAELVNKQLLEDSLCYNLINGGSVSVEWLEERKQYYSRTFKTFLGKRHTEETKRKISESSKGKVQSAETKAKKSKAMKGKQSYWKNKKQSATSNNKRSIAHLNLPKVICPYCNRSISPQNAKRWHLQNCKLAD